MMFSLVLALASAGPDWKGIHYSNGHVYVTMERRGAKRTYSLNSKSDGIVFVRERHASSLRLVRRAERKPSQVLGKREILSLLANAQRPAVRLICKTNLTDGKGFRWLIASVVGTKTRGRWEDVLIMEGNPYRIIQNATGTCTVFATDNGAEISIWDTSRAKLVRNTQGIYLRDLGWIPNSAKAVVVGGKNGSFLGVIDLRTGGYRELTSLEPGWFSGFIAYDHGRNRILLLASRTRANDPATYYEERDMNGKLLNRTKILLEGN